MQLSAPFYAVGRLVSRWHDAIVDPARRERTVLASLLIYVLLWTAYGTIAKSSQGLHPDMTEIVAWSRDLSLGYLKHPPFAAWLVWLWFSVFPLTEWFYYLLAMLMPGIALWIVWRISADYLDVEKRIVGVALLTFVPFFNFHALKFNVNTVLLPLWAATTFFFLRSIRSRGAICAALAGIAAAGSMLGKYWSVFLVAGLALVPIVDRHRFRYFRSTAPWITIAAGLFALWAHLIWLLDSDFKSFSYALIVHGDKPFGEAFASAAGYLAGAFGYVAIPIIITFAIAWPSIKILADIAWPRENERRVVAVAFWAPLLLPVVGAVAASADINSLWSMPVFSLFSIVLLSSTEITVHAIDARRVLFGAALLPMVMLIASPAIAIMVQFAGPAPAAAQTRLLANEVERLWHLTTPRPLRFVGGDADLAYGVITYAVDRPRALTALPQPSRADIMKHGFVLLCFAEDKSCRRQMSGRGPDAKEIETEIVRNFFRVAGIPQRYTILIVPPTSITSK
jgi:4-amino-4-deoxy-L-arabinose transferase-like glycosyltransferase